jgi:hypothetical protein
MRVVMKKKAFAIGATAAVLICLASMCCADGLSSLAAVGESQKEMVKILDKETIAFEAVQKAVKYDQITEGQTQEEIQRRYGKPVLVFAEDATETWVYKPGYATWFDTIKVYLHFDATGTLAQTEMQGIDE